MSFDFAQIEVAYPNVCCLSAYVCLRLPRHFEISVQHTNYQRTWQRGSHIPPNSDSLGLITTNKALSEGSQTANDSAGRKACTKHGEP